MSLSDKGLRKLLSTRFVSGWVNTDGDDAAGGSFAHAPSDGPGSCVRGNGRANLQLLVLTPDGEIFHALAGFVSAADLERELRYSLDTWKLMTRSPKLRREIVVDRARELRESASSGSAKESTDEVTRILATFGRDAAARGPDFVAKRPLLPIADFRTAMLGGGGASFFGSSSGSRPGETIGRAPPSSPDLDDLLERRRKSRERRGRTGDDGDSAEE